MMNILYLLSISDDKAKNIIITISVIAAILIAFLVLHIVFRRKLKNKPKEENSEENSNIDLGKKPTYTLKIGEILLEQNKEYTISSESNLLPGKYTLYTLDKNQVSFRVRINSDVVELENNSTYNFNENDTILPLNSNLIIK